MEKSPSSFPSRDSKLLAIARAIGCDEAQHEVDHRKLPMNNHIYAAILPHRFFAELADSPHADDDA